MREIFNGWEIVLSGRMPDGSESVLRDNADVCMWLRKEWMEGRLFRGKPCAPESFTALNNTGLGGIRRCHLEHMPMTWFTWAKYQADGFDGLKV